MIKLAPSILSADFAKLGEQIKEVEEAGAHYLHIDVMDGCFVPNISLGVPVIKSIRRMTDMTFDVHLMVQQPERFFEDFAKAGADLINFHVEATEHVEEAIAKIKTLHKRVGITIKPNTEVEAVLPYLADVDMVLVMGVEPGFGGQSLITETLKKVEQIADVISQKGYFTEIEIDGGINMETVSQALSAGANVIVAGSAVFDSGDITKSIRDFYTLFQDFVEHNQELGEPI